MSDPQAEEPEANRPALLFLHGFSLDHRMWRQQVEALHPQYRVITVDLPGFGPQARDCGLVSPAEQLERALDKCGVLKVHLVGHSVGAAVAIEHQRSTGSGGSGERRLRLSTISYWHFLQRHCPAWVRALRGLRLVLMALISVAVLLQLRRGLEELPLP
jgi:hypothetical protein